MEKPSPGNGSPRFGFSLAVVNNGKKDSPVTEPKSYRAASWILSNSRDFTLGLPRRITTSRAGWHSSPRERRRQDGNRRFVRGGAA